MRSVGDHVVRLLLDLLPPSWKRNPTLFTAYASTSYSRVLAPTFVWMGLPADVYRLEWRMFCRVNRDRCFTKKNTLVPRTSTKSATARLLILQSANSLLCVLPLPRGRPCPCISNGGLPRGRWRRRVRAAASAGRPSIAFIFALRWDRGPLRCAAPEGGAIAQRCRGGAACAKLAPSPSYSRTCAGAQWRRLFHPRRPFE